MRGKEVGRNVNCSNTRVNILLHMRPCHCEHFDFTAKKGQRTINHPNLWPATLTLIGLWYTVSCCLGVSSPKDMFWCVNGSDQECESKSLGLLLLHDNIYPSCRTVEHLSFTLLFLYFLPSKCNMFSSPRPPPGAPPVVFLFLSILLITYNISPSPPDAVVYVSLLSTAHCLPTSESSSPLSRCPFAKLKC